MASIGSAPRTSTPEHVMINGEQVIISSLTASRDSVKKDSSYYADYQSASPSCPASGGIPPPSPSSAGLTLAAIPASLAMSITRDIIPHIFHFGRIFAAVFLAYIKIFPYLCSRKMKMPSDLRR